jgi:hypothetical protein
LGTTWHSCRRPQLPLNDLLQAIAGATLRRPAFVLESDVTPLGGLTLADMRLLLSRRGLELPDAAAVDLYASTEGNAELVVLAVDTLRRTKEPACVISRLGD